MTKGTTMNILNRLKKLEQETLGNSLLIYIFRWTGNLGVRAKVTFDGKEICREQGEAEQAFLDRAGNEIRVNAGDRKLIIAFAY